MSNYIPMFNQGDPVYYTGEKHKQALSSKDGKPFKGWIHAPVQNEPGAFVVWFPDTKEQDSYVLSAQNLTRAKPPKVDKVQEGPLVEHVPSRRKKGED
jgi:hypothetical protein